MANPYAFVTLLTSDAYLPGVLTLAAALRDIHPSPPQVDFQTVCLVTPQTVDVSIIKTLRRAFIHVIGVESIELENNYELQLLGRPDLKQVLTKLHVFRLTQFSKIIFLDADVLPIRPISHLFNIPHEFSAVPDSGWPDAFNSGVFVFTPGEDKFRQLSELLKSKGTWDGGDQGILNQWREGNWNRLSFTYNTTPNAAYSYAPAYERFGSKISVVHFIGAHKPWHYMPWRAPGTTSSQTKDASADSNDSQRIYDYDSLVDRWYEVYDRHYRSQAVVPDTEFEVKKYASAWDTHPEAGAEPHPTSGRVLGLEDLKRLALEGMSASTVIPETAPGMGDYTSMPLEGRLDLIPLRRTPEPELVEPEAPPPTIEAPSPTTETPTPTTEEHAKLPPPQMGTQIPPPNGEYFLDSHPHHEQISPSPSTPTQQHPLLYSGGAFSRMTTLPTPRPDELPSTPHLGFYSLPGTPTPAPLQRYDARPDLGTPLRHLPPEYRPSEESHTPQRPSSPPLLSWNPSIEPPPTSVPDASGFPTDTYFPNVWDRRDTEDAHLLSPIAPETLFQAPPPTEIPEPLLRQGHYRKVTGISQENASPSPDRSKVKPLFPWENRPRHHPARVFPGTDSPPPGMFLPPTPSTSPEQRGQRIPAVPSPLAGLPTNLLYANAWDTVPGIQKYASKLVRPPPAVLAPAFEGVPKGNGKRLFSGSMAEYRRWLEQSETMGRDADDEGEGGEEDEGKDVVSSESESEKRVRRSRSGSRSSSVVKKGKKEYKVRGVQTIKREKRSEGVQVTPAILKAAHIQGQLARDTRRLRTTFIGSPVDAPVKETIPGKPPVTTMSMLIPKSEAPAGTISPRDFSSQKERSPTHSMVRTQLPFPSFTKATESVPLLTVGKVEDGNDVSSATSPPSSIGPISPPDYRASILSPRKSSRVWDPARGVEVFKRGSEEALAKFLRIGEEESSVR